MAAGLAPELSTPELSTPELSTPELSTAASWGSLGAALLLLFFALRPPAKNWLLEYHPSATLDGPATRAWVRRADFDLAHDTLLQGVPDREDFSVRLASCLPVSEPEDVTFRLAAANRARLYVDDALVLDSLGNTTKPAPEHEPRRGRHAKLDGLPVKLQPGSHLIAIEYGNAEGVGRLHFSMSGRGRADAQLQASLERPGLDARCDAR